MKFYVESSFYSHLNKETYEKMILCLLCSRFFAYWIFYFISILLNVDGIVKERNALTCLLGEVVFAYHYDSLNHDNS